MRSIKTHLTIVLLLCILLPTGLIGTTACWFVFNNIKENRIVSVGRIAAERHDDLRLRLLEYNERGKGLLNNVVTVCAHNKNTINACALAKLEQFVAVNHTAGLNFHSRIDNDLAIGVNALPLTASAFQANQIVVTSTSQVNDVALLSFIATDAASGFSLVTTYTGQKLQDIFIGAPVLGQSGETFLADKQGFFITQPRYTPQQGIRNPISALPMQRCLRGESSETLELDYRNIAIIHGFHFVPEIGGGCIMAHVNQAEAFAPLARLIAGLSVLFCLFAGFALLVAATISKSMSKPIIALADVAQALPRGDFIPRVSSTKYQEIAELIQLFNSMARQLANSLEQLKASERELEQKVIERTTELHERHRRYHSVIQTTGEGFWRSDKAGHLLEVNPAYVALSGYSETELLKLRFSDLDAQETPAETVKHIEKIIARGTDTFETKHRRKDGSIWHVEVNTSFIADDGGYFISFFRDISERKRIELDLHIAAVAFESQEAIVITDTQSIILRINKAFTASTGYTEQESVGQKISMLKSGRHGIDFYVAMWQRLLSTGSWQGEIWDRRKNGEIYPKWLSITAVKDGDGVVSHYVATHTDITEYKNAEEQIKQLAFYDPLTGLPNRRLLQERLKHSIDREHRYDGKQFALLLLDLDRFKAVNDSLGHLAGDELLQQVGQRITTRLRDVDMVARLGGDEFVVLLEDIAHSDDAARVAEKIVAALSQSFALTQSDNVQIGVSIGISLYPQHGDSPEQLMDHADAALYQAKAAGRGGFAYFSQELTLAARERIVLENRLRKAIEQEELRVFYQPQVDIASGRMVGAEALVRWQDPDNGLISPTHFIAIAEETGLIMEIGNWVLHETCRQGKQWLDAGLPPVTLAVNVSPQQFCGDICALVTTVLAETGFPAEHLELEITESGLMKNQTNVITILSNLRKQGVRFAIDDFGTGYSSLAYLKHFPLDVLKIDKSFIDDIPFLQSDMAITATIIAIADRLGFKVLAEGVETYEQLVFLQLHGCDMYQGYLYSKPLTATDFAELLANLRHNHCN